jgi:hypothetical protein
MGRGITGNETECENKSSRPTSTTCTPFIDEITRVETDAGRITENSLLSKSLEASDVVEPFHYNTLRKFQTSHLT